MTVISIFYYGIPVHIPHFVSEKCADLKNIYKYSFANKIGTAICKGNEQSLTSNKHTKIQNQALSSAGIVNKFFMV